jgi:anaerobic dimethyl sulfoxide reductase subunit B (iron-sulfur subunit)
MSERVIAFNFHPELCVGCGRCITTCLDVNDIDLDKFLPLRTLTVKESVGDGGKIRIEYYTAACMHCEDMPCAKACPQGCYRKDAWTGLVILDNSECAGCGKCAAVCPFSAIKFCERKAVKCTGCIDRVRENLLPACVACCSRKAITVDERNLVLRKGRRQLKQALRQ